MLLRSFLKDTPAWRLARGLKRAAAPPRNILAAGDRRGLITWTNAPPACERGATLDLRLRAVNRSGTAWPAGGLYPVSLCARWLTRFGEDFDQPAMAIPLSQPLYPGEPRELAASIVAPDVVGDFTLAIDFVQDGRGFADTDPDLADFRTSMTVVGPRATDIDYHSVYRTADLDQNHWWVVGAYHSKEQYERSSRERLDMLVRCGLMPDAHVLDVGCGTGQMAGAMENFLSSRGGYAGTDIGAEAVAFCERTFHQKNFAFRQGGMTDVPFEADGTFDMAIFFSVFTHTFPDETALLLAEARRLLKPTGTIIADVITSPLVERGAGHRGEMVLNREYFLKLAGMLGYTAEVIGRWPWNRHAERFMFQLRQV